MTTEEPLVLRSDSADGLTTLTLNRPSQFNSLSKEMLPQSRPNWTPSPLPSPSAWS